jgi:anthranilate phosphoribosyltransferase
MKNILNRLINHEMLTAAEAKEVLVNISNGSYNKSNLCFFDRLHDAQHQH